MVGTLGGLPEWVAIAWTLAFIVVVGFHCHHLIGTHGQRRAWHSTHVAMALGMAFMYAPPTIEHLDISGSFWQLGYGSGVVVILLWMSIQILDRRAINWFWPLVAIDLSAMFYMWRAGEPVAPITWLLVTYLAAQGTLWATNAYRGLDGRLQIGGTSAVSIGPDGSFAVVAPISAQPLMSRLELRGSMITMTLGMAYMLAAMQLAAH